MKARLLLLVVALLAGCASSSRPDAKVPWVSWDHTRVDGLRILRQRAAAVKTVSAVGDLTMTRPNGQSVRLDLAMVSRKPGDLRLRAWKLGRAVFDLTLTPDGLWLFTPDDKSLKDQAHAGGLDAAKLARSWRLFNGGFFDSDDIEWSDGYQVQWLRRMVDGMEIICMVRTGTLVPHTYDIYQPTDAKIRHSEFTLVLSDYRMIADVPYPFQYEARSRSGTIKINLREVELNSELPQGAFVAPKRAEKLP
jgi:hypothetical protein